jgi:hypothetical protein
MSGGLPSLSSYTHSSGGYTNHYSTGSDPFKVRRKTKTAKYNAAATAAAAREAAAHRDSIIGNILGVGGNLLHDAKDMATGAIPGTIQAVEHPGKALDAVVTDYKTRYGRILHGDFSDLTKHPLSYILDAATVASGGLGAVAKAGQVGKVAEAAAAGSRTAKYLNDIGKARETKIAVAKGGPKTVSVSLASHPYVRARQRTLLKLQSAPGVAKVPVFGANAKARRTLIGQQRNAEAGVRNTQPAYERAVKQLKNATAIHVFDTVARGTSPTHELQFFHHPDIHEHLSDEAHSLLDHLKSPETHKLYDEVVKHLKDSGAGQKDPYAASVKGLSKNAQHVVEALKQHKKLTDQATGLLVNTGKVGVKEALARRVAHLKIQDEVRGQKVKQPIEYMREAKERTGVLPQFVTDKMILADSKGGTFEGKLYKAGVRHPNPELAIAKHEQAASASSIQRAHSVLKENAQHIPDDKKLPKGWTWLRESDPVHDFIGVNLERFSKETQPLIESAIQAAAKDRGVDPREMYFESLTQGVPNSARLAVPKTLAQDMIDKHTRMAGTASEMLRKATSLWKGAVLAYRPAFISNNLLGNQALYHLRNGLSVRDLGRELGAVKRDRPAFEQFFNEHNQTFGHAERFLSDSKSAKVGNLAYKMVGAHELWLRAATMRRHALKLPEVRAEMRKLKGGTYDASKHGGRTIFHESLARAVHKNPHIKDEIARVIDDTMGNYRHYNKFEEGLRQLIPFYGWSRHSVRSFERLLADRPAFAQAIAEVSHEGNKQQQKDFPGTPDFMKSYLKAHLPGGINAVDTRGLNPMLAATDTVEGAKQALNMKPGEMDKALSVINPLIMDAIQSATHSNLTTGAPLPKTAFDNLPAGELLGQLIEGLPQVKIGSHLAGSDQPDKNSDRYNLTPTGRPAKHKTPMLTHSNVDLIASLLGAPVKDVNLPAAQAFQKKIDATKQPHFHASNPRKKKPKRIKF